VQDDIGNLQIHIIIQMLYRKYMFYMKMCLPLI